MSLTTRIFFTYFAILGVAIYFFLSVFMSEIKPGVRQSTEDTLIDMSNLLAEIVKDDLVNQRLQSSDFKAQVERFLKRSYRASIDDVDKLSSTLRVYITDEKGIVQFDSADFSLGADYSQWNDVYLTLRGKYGARSSPVMTAPDVKVNPDATVMHVAAAIVDQGEIIGSITVAKANLSLQPFIEMAQQKIQTRGIFLVLVSVFAALLFSFWLTASIRKLTRYADKIAEGVGVKIPKLAEPELRKLAASVDNMRTQLAGKEYVEKYIHALTHELKSPVSAIKGAAEIITDDMPAVDRERFVGNIRTEVERINVMISKLLELAKIEKCDVLTARDKVNINDLVEQVLISKSILIEHKSIIIKFVNTSVDVVAADQFLLTQAVDNLLQNALDFSATNSVIEINIADKNGLLIEVKDWGAGIPDYALDKVFERFYSLPRADGCAKSSGLGLCFVKQICTLHQGRIDIKNHSEGGVLARLYIPI